MPTQTITLPVQRREEIAPEVFCLEAGPTEPPVEWRAGQWASLHLLVGEHQPLVRAYTLAAPPDGSGILPFVFDRVEGGLGSSWLAERTPGDSIEMAGIVGKFVLPDPLDEPIVFAARYTGIVPIRAMLLALRDVHAPPDVTLVYGAPNADGLLFHDEFRRLAESAPWFTYRPILLTPGGAPGIPVGEEIDILRDLPGLRPPTVPMLCGVRAFTHPLRELLMEERGYLRRAVKVENFD